MSVNEEPPMIFPVWKAAVTSLLEVRYGLTPDTYQIKWEPAYVTSRGDPEPIVTYMAKQCNLTRIDKAIK